MVNEKALAMDCLPDVDYAKACMDEIALEGLDGITASALWIRLSHRPNFRMALDDAARSFLWETVVHNRDLEFYLLPEPRPPLVIHNRFENIDTETGIVFASQDDSSTDDIYPYALITEPGVLGSCSTYQKREKVTDQVRPNQVHFMSLAEAQKMWGESLVLVASAERRRQALMGPETNPNLQLLPVQYAMLERIGRTRYLGDVSGGQSVISSNAKTLFYYRKFLLKNNLIVKQVHHHYLKRGNQTLLRNGMLFHITRFYVERKSKIFMLYHELVRHLLTMPTRADTVTNIMAILGVSHKPLKKTFRKGLRRFADIIQEPFRIWHPDTTPDQWYYINKSEKMESVIRLLNDTDQNSVERILSEEAEAACEASKSNSKGGDDEDDDEDDAVDDGQPSSSNKNSAIPDQSRHILDRSVLHQAYDAFIKAGPDGLSERGLATALGVPRLEGRSVCRKLLRINAVTSIMKDRGRQKYKSYSAKCFTEKSEHHKEIIDECQKLLEFASDAQMKREEEEKRLREEEAAKKAKEAETEPPSPPKSKRRRRKKAPEPTVPEVTDTFLDDVRKMSESGNSITLANSGLVTSRAMKRANLIVKVVREAKLFDSPFMLQKVITADEAQEDYRIDRKSLLRLLSRLNAAGLVKSVKSVLRYGEHEKKVHFICDPSLKSNDPLIYSALENAKLKYFSKYRVQQQTMDKLSLLDPIQRSSAILRNLRGKERNNKIDGIPVNGRIYGFEPKFVRMKLLHQYMFYLVYDYDGREILLTDENYPSELREFTEKSFTTIAPVFHVENSWKRYLPSLPQHSGWKRGWCLFSDILLRMPLSLLVKLVNVNYKVDGLRDYLDHPILRHMPITHLPDNLRAAVLYARRYIFRIYDIISQLAYMGIMSCNQQHKEKDQAFFYLHRTARIIETTISKPGYVKISLDEEYPVHMYKFASGIEVAMFWETLETICLRTPLGAHPRQEHESVTFDIDLDKKPGMPETMVSKTDDQIVDDGTQPGDNLGAGGLDSAFFSHLKRNWSWVSIGNEPRPIRNRKLPVKKPDRGEGESEEPSLIAKFMLSEANMLPPNPRKRLTRLAINNQLLVLTAKKSNQKPPETETKTQSPEIEKPPPSKVSRIRQCKIRKKQIRRPYYDDKDMAALKLMTKIRATWSAKEDSLLLLAKVACFLLASDGVKRRTVVPFSVIRDFLHKHVEDSRSKTSRACERRMRYMLLNPETSFNVSVFVGESKDDPVIRDICDRPRIKETNRDEWSDRFETVVDQLLVKFKSSSSTNKPEKFQLPDTLEELEARYNVTLSQELLEKKHTLTDVKNVVDIHFGVVYSLILSSVGSSKDGNNWNHLLYQIYQQYPESLLRSVLAKLRSQLIVSRRKDAPKRMPKKTSLCLVTFPYQLSITYQNLFLSTYKDNIFYGAFELMGYLVNDSTDTLSAGIDIGIGNTLGGATAIVSLIHGQQAQFVVEIPDNMIVLNVEYAKENDSCRQFLQKFYAWEAKHLAQKQDESGVTSNVDLDKDKDEGESDEAPAKKKAKLDNTDLADNSMLMDVDAGPKKAPIKMMDVDADPKEALMKINSSSRFALYMLRRQMNEKILSDTQHSQDYLGVNACKVVCKLHSSPWLLMLRQKSHPRHLDKLKMFVPETIVTVEEVARIYKSLGLNEEAVREMRNLYVFLQNKRELGAQFVELNETFGYQLRTIDLKSHLDLMRENNLVLRVGQNTVRYVVTTRAKPWLLHSLKPTNKSAKFTMSATTIAQTMGDELDAIPRDQIPAGNKMPILPYTELKNPELLRHTKPVQCVCRPWRKPNGELNRPILNEMLRSIMSHVMCFPGVTYASVCDKYASVLTPVQMLELLEVLEDAGCVRRTFVLDSCAPTLFGPPTTALIVENDEDGAVVHYHPEIDCIIKLGRILFSH